MTPMKFQINYTAKPTDPTNGKVYDNTAVINPNDGTIPVEKKATVTYQGNNSSSSSVLSSSSSIAVSSSSSSIPAVPPLTTEPTPSVTQTGVDKNGTQNSDGTVSWNISGELLTSVDNNQITIYDGASSDETIDYNTWTLSFTGGNNGGEGIQVENIPLSTLLAHGWATISKTSTGFELNLDPNAIAKAYGLSKLTPMKFSIHYKTTQKIQLMARPIIIPPSLTLMTVLFLYLKKLL